MHPIFVFLALVGHAFVWIGLVNRLHSVGIRRRTISAATFVCFLFASLIPMGIGWWYATSSNRSASDNAPFLIAAYAVVCWLAVPGTLLRLVAVRFSQRRPPIVRFHGRRQAIIDPASAAANPGEIAHHFLTRLPRNEILRLEVSQWTLDVPRLPAALDGLSIVHLSDLHYTGRIGKAYFREVIRTCNELQPDLVCITGDILDRAIGFDWIADTLGQLAARHGVYFILGNHDLRVDSDRLRRTLEHCGLVDLGGRWQQIEIRETPVVLIGNERPWIDGVVGWVERSEPHQDPRTTNGGARCARPTLHGLRIVLAHSPDQFAWARANDADLMLAGHTHGGQIRIPPLGAICSPTRHGVKYISGIFHTPPTILHVTRGVSGDIPVRWNCPPEIAMLKLLTVGKVIP